MGVDFVLRNAKKLLIFGILITALIAAGTLFFGLVASTVSSILPSLSYTFVPYFVPSNLGFCISTMIAVKTAGSVYEATLQILKWKVDVLA